MAGLSERGAVDVGEDVLAHPLAAQGRDHGAITDGNDKGGVVDEDDGLTRALRGEPVDAVGEPLEAVAGDVDVAALDPLQGVRRELEPARGVLEDVAELRP